MKDISPPTSINHNDNLTTKEIGRRSKIMNPM